MNLSFAGCGFLGIYHVGVASCFKEYAPHLVTGKISGASAGAIAACALITDVCLGESTSYVLRIAAKARARALGPLHPSFNLMKIVREGLEDFLPEDAYKIANGRLHISLTRVSDRKCVIVNQFDSNEDLLQALECSSFVPFYCGMFPPKYKGVRYVDGGLSNNIPELDENTVKVSPVAGESDICPTDVSQNDMHMFYANTSVQFTSANLYRMSYAFFPPHPEILGQMCKKGFDDALRFLQKNNLISCMRHLSIQSSITADEPIDDGNVDCYTHHTTHELYEELKAEYNSDVDFVKGHEGHVGHDFASCNECRDKRLALLQDSLPESVMTAVQAAIDSVNKGLLSTIYNLRAYKVVSLIAAPWLLPLDMTVELGRRVYQWAPYMPADMQWFVKEFAVLLEDSLHFLRYGRHKYSARFTCQLAITETDYNQDQIMSSKPGTPLLSRRGSKTPSTGEAHYAPSRCRNLNLGFSVDFKTHRKGPLQCVDELRHELQSRGESIPGSLLGSRRTSRNPSRAGSRATSRRSSLVSLDDDHDFTVDSIEIDSKPITEGNVDSNYEELNDCLKIANQTGSVLAFYYNDEDNPNVVKVTEIFALEEDQVQPDNYECEGLLGKGPMMGNII